MVLVSPFVLHFLNLKSDKRPMTAFSSTRLGKTLGGICLLFIVAGAWLFLSDARHRAIVNTGRNNIRGIYRGLQIYEDSLGKMPPAIARDAEGKPLSSWRFQILPFMESTKRRCDRKSAWDAPANSSMRQLQVASFDAGGFVRGRWEGESLRMSAVGVDGLWALDSGKLLKDLPGNTLLAISAPIKGTHWMEPSEVELHRPFAKEATIGGALGITRSDVVYLLFADGRSEVISSAAPLTEINQYLPTLD
jgi:hypothetical protein